MKRLFILLLMIASAFLFVPQAQATSIDGDDPNGSVSHVTQTTYTNLTTGPTGDANLNTDKNMAISHWRGNGYSFCGAWAEYMATMSPTDVLANSWDGSPRCSGNQYFMIDREFYNANKTKRQSSDASLRRLANRKLCLVIFHEYGHLAGWQNASGGDHSSDSNSLMYALLKVSNLAQLPNACESQYP